MNNLQLDIDQIQQKIGDILYNIEDSKYNVTEGYMIYKDLRNLIDKNIKVFFRVVVSDSEEDVAKYV